MQEYYHKNRSKYNLKVHLVLVTKYRKKILQDKIAATVKAEIQILLNSNNWNTVAMETDTDHIHILLCYNPEECISSIVKSIKQKTTYAVWLLHASILSKHYWQKRVFWSDGYFACSIGEASSKTIENYIASQG